MLLIWIVLATLLLEGKFRRIAAMLKALKLYGCCPL